MVPQLPIAMLACARIGAVHSVVFGGFSAEALSGRLIDAQSTVILTANGVMRGKKPIPLYEIVNAAADICGEACMLIDTSIDPSVITSRRFGFSTLRIGSSTTQNVAQG